MLAPTLDQLAVAFAAIYGAPPTHLACAPGRVNLIGEHIDYAGLPVLPMAIQRRIRIAFRPIDEAECRIASDAPGLEPRIFRLDEAIEPYAAGDWGNYVKAAAHGLSGPGDVPAESAAGCGIEALVASDLPAAAGLGSSSALVVATALSLAATRGLSIRPLELAVRTAEAEQLSGTRGGGMDQAICLCSRDGSASLIEFTPLRVEWVPVPTDWRFVVAYSLIEARKSGDARATYNRRRAEVESALSEVSEGLGPGSIGPAARSPSVHSYRALLDTHSPEALLEAADRTITADLRPRFRHVVTEAGRVRRALEALKAADMSAFGEQMNASHRSLRDDFEVSAAELNALVDIARDAGAAGARLTGAGLGGSIVALVAPDRVSPIIEALTERFYARRLSLGEDRRARIDEALFVAEPSGGASVRRIASPAD